MVYNIIIKSKEEIYYDWSNYSRHYLYARYGITSNSDVHLMAHKSEIIETKGHPFVGVQWPVIGSKGDKYHVEMVNYGFECNCIAYAKCKHIKGIESLLADPLGEDKELV
jgi:hypothetical protein